MSSTSSISPNSDFSESDVLDISDEEAAKKSQKILALEKVLDPNLRESWPKWFLKCAKSQLKKIKIKPEDTEISNELNSTSSESEARNEVSSLQREERKKSHDFLITQEHRKNKKNSDKFVLESFNISNEMKNKPLDRRVLAALTELDPIVAPSIFKLVIKQSCKKMKENSEKLIYFQTSDEKKFAQFLADTNVSNPCPSEIVVETKLNRLDGRYCRTSDYINSRPTWVSNNGVNAIFFSAKTQNWVIGRNSSIGVNYREFIFKSDSKTKYPSDSDQWSTLDGTKITSIKLIPKKKIIVGKPNHRFSRFTTKTTRILKR